MGVVYSCSCKNLNNEIGDSQNTETDRNCVQNLYAVRPNLVFPNEVKVFFIFNLHGLEDVCVYSQF